ncbi:MAG: hypothetical protein U0T83_09235 [Bacteriovoracaceae bacterium]
MYQILSKGHRKGILEPSALEQAELAYENTKIEAYISFSKKTEYLFINSRLILDKPLLNYINFQLNKLFPSNSEISYFIFLTVPSSEIDVNVHPNKTVVKFVDQNLIYSLIAAVLKKFQKKPESIETLPQDFDMTFDTAKNINENSNNHFPFFQYDELFVVAPFHLINFKEFLINFFTEKLLTNPIKHEDELQPLFVAEPIQLAPKNLDSHLHFFKHQGFELERINQDFMILKTVPKLLHCTPPILRLLNSYFVFINEHLKNTNFISTTRDFFSNTNIDYKNLFLEFYSLIPLESSTYVKPFTKEKLQQLLHADTI